MGFGSSASRTVGGSVTTGAGCGRSPLLDRGRRTAQVRGSRLWPT